MDEGQNQGKGSEKVTIHYPQMIEDLVRHAGDFFESASKALDKVPRMLEVLTVRMELQNKQLEQREAQVQQALGELKEVKRAYVAQSNALKDVDRRLKSVEQGDRRPLSDNKTRPHKGSAPRRNQPTSEIEAPNGSTQHAQREEATVQNSGDNKEVIAKFDDPVLRAGIQNFSKGNGT